MTRRLFITLMVLIAGISLAGQEVVTGLTGNSLLTDPATKASGKPGKGIADTLELPFLDDFSYAGHYPDTILWTDRNLFINNTFSSDQISWGLATFDLLDEAGRLYANADTWVFKADILTSKPININLLPSDSLFLSFLYQPGGMGDLPEEGDSLTLQFWSPETASWHHIWKAEGGEPHPFRSIIIPIVQTHFLKKGFRLRFTAYGSLSESTADPAMKTSGDNWNIDYVWLDRDRNSADTIYHDVAITLPLRSLLKTHESMPMKHFRQVVLNEMGSAIPVTYRNNDTITRNVTRMFDIKNLNTGETVHTSDATAVNTDSMSVVSYDAPLFFSYSTTGSDTVDYRVRSWLITDEFDRKANDTLFYIQQFGNVFSFDDGSAEAGYGINGLGSRNAMVAYRFRAWVPDSLRAIEICFNDSYLNSNQRSFDLAVWNNNAGVPGDMIYVMEEVMVEQGEGINGFHTYILDDPVYIDNVFFIGWRQRSETFLNAGFDFNTPHGGRQYYWLNNDWYQSQMNGTLMIRAVTGPRIPATGVENISLQPQEITLWPNPVRDIMNIATGDQLSGPLTIVIYDMTGRIVYTGEYRQSVDVSSLRPGVYVLVTSRGRVPVARNRFIKAG
ncbi:MAG: T9SS type A sorting domain-containing protein [Bacteroidales bacterium]|jgi:hypothetical protein|nr:T9SS type A sorting domain-containing protein [Bacteroidales bacterium]